MDSSGITQTSIARARAGRLGRWLLDAAREMIASYHDEGREPPIGGGHVEPLTIDLAA